MKKKSNFHRFLRIMFQYKSQHLLASICMVFDAFLLLALPYLTMQIIDGAIRGNNAELLLKLGILYLATILLQSGSKLLSDYLYSKIGKQIVYDLRYMLVNHLQKLSGKFYSNVKAGELAAVINNDVANIEELATKMIFSTVSDILVTVPMLFFLLQLQFDLLIVALILQPFMLILQTNFTKKVTQKTMELRNSFGEFSAIIQEFLTSLMHVSILGAQKYFFSKFNPNAKKFMKAGIGLEMTFSLSTVSINLISALTTIGILGYGGYKVIIGSMTIGALVAFIQYSQRLLAPIMRAAQLGVKLKQALVSVDRIFGVLDEPVEINQMEEGHKPEKIAGKIEFKNVSFSYEEKTPVIENMSVTFENNRTTAIVGESGSGKSTIANLIFRLWDVNKGQILLDDIDIKEYNLDYLRKNISIVSQETFLFNDTILNNLLLSNKNISMDKVIEATKKADIYDFIMSLPEQFNTIVGDRGVKLSGGQKQRISIARAILRDSPVIILDEATSSLDNNSEKNIKEALNDFLKNKTVIIIAHRLSTVENADIIYTMKKGKIVEKGTHDELMKLGKAYYELYVKSQSA